MYAGKTMFVFFFSSRRRHTIFKCDWSSDVCSSDLQPSSSDLPSRIHTSCTSVPTRFIHPPRRLRPASVTSVNSSRVWTRRVIGARDRDRGLCSGNDAQGGQHVINYRREQSAHTASFPEHRPRSRSRAPITRRVQTLLEFTEVTLASRKRLGGIARQDRRRERVERLHDARTGNRMGHDLAGWPPRSVGVKEGRSTAFVASTTMRPLQSDIELTAPCSTGNWTARVTMSALAASLTVTAFTFEPSLRTMSFSELGPRLLASETSIPLLAK